MPNDKDSSIRIKWYCLIQVTCLRNVLGKHKGLYIKKSCPNWNWDSDLSEHANDLVWRLPEVNVSEVYGWTFSGRGGMPWCLMWSDEGRGQSIAFDSILFKPSRARGCRQMMKQLFLWGMLRHRGINSLARGPVTGCDTECGEWCSPCSTGLSMHQCRLQRGPHHLGIFTGQGSPTPGPQTGTSPCTVRNWASQQEISGRGVIEASLVFASTPQS